MIRFLQFAFAVSALCVVPNAPFAADEPKGPAGRPGIAVKADVVGKKARVTIALNFLQDAKDKPRFEGVRFYTYELVLGEQAPRLIGWKEGWKAEKDIQATVLHGKKYTYFRGDTDRQENGSMSIVRQTKDSYRITGVYHYMERLFIIHGVVKSGEPLLLFESPGSK